MQAGAERARSALGWIAAAVVLVAVAGFVYLRPDFGSAAGPRPAAPAPRSGLAGEVQLLAGTFGDARHGVITVIRPGSTLATYVTADGGRTWRPEPGIVNYLGDGSGAIEWSGARATQARLTVDGGRSWRTLQLPESVGGQQPAFLDGARAWTMVSQAPGPGGQSIALWRTDDAGANWQPLRDAGIPEEGAKGGLTFVDADHGVLTDSIPGGVKTILATEDGGQSWRPAATLSSPLPDARPLSVGILRHGGRLVAWLLTATGQVGSQSATFDAVQSYTLASDDGGRTWSAPVAGPRLDPRLVGRPVIDGRGRLLLLASRRLWVSEDDGRTWSAR
ncbi:MAG TPA: hypothetical protein VOB72_06090, partial [Candidatus Dormibacteraeota bacterium]|nr:hypothetical protein [Candidatus Dormibacteraeota bacterium]